MDRFMSEAELVVVIKNAIEDSLETEKWFSHAKLPFWWGEETISLAAKAATSVILAAAESQIYAQKEGYLKPT